MAERHFFCTDLWFPSPFHGPHPLSTVRCIALGTTTRKYLLPHVNKSRLFSPLLSFTFRACVNQHVLLFCGFYFVLADAGNVSAPCKLKSRLVVVVLFSSLVGSSAVMCYRGQKHYIYSIAFCVVDFILVTLCYFLMAFLIVCFHFVNLNREELNRQNGQKPLTSSRIVPLRWQPINFRHSLRLWNMHGPHLPHHSL